MARSRCTTCALMGITMCLSAPTCKSSSRSLNRRRFHPLPYLSSRPGPDQDHQRAVQHAAAYHESRAVRSACALGFLSEHGVRRKFCDAHRRRGRRWAMRQRGTITPADSGSQRGMLSNSPQQGMLAGAASPTLLQSANGGQLGSRAINSPRPCHRNASKQGGTKSAASATANDFRRRNGNSGHNGHPQSSAHHDCEPRMHCKPTTTQDSDRERRSSGWAEQLER